MKRVNIRFLRVDNRVMERFFSSDMDFFILVFDMVVSGILWGESIKTCRKFDELPACVSSSEWLFQHHHFKRFDFGIGYQFAEMDAACIISAIKAGSYHLPHQEQDHDVLLILNEE